jgi:virginiamycin A acetyltransferase
MIETHRKTEISPLVNIEDSDCVPRVLIGGASVIDSFVRIKPTGGG